MDLIVAAIYFTRGFQIQIQVGDYVLAQNQAKGGESTIQLQTANITGELTKPAGGNPYDDEIICTHGISLSFTFTLLNSFLFHS